MDVCASYYAITDEQIMLYEKLVNEDRQQLISALNSLPYDKNFLCIGELWEIMHYIVNGFDKDPMYNHYLPDDMKTAYYCAFFGGEWSKDCSLGEDDKGFVGKMLYETIIDKPENYFEFIKSDGFVFLSIIRSSKTHPSLLAKIVQVFDTKNINNCLRNNASFEAVDKLSKMIFFSEYAKKADYDILLKHIQNSFSRMRIFYENALKNNRSILVLISSSKDYKNDIDNLAIKEMKR